MYRIVWRRKNLIFVLMSLVILTFYFYIFTSTITIDSYISRHHPARAISVSGKNSSDLMDLVAPPLDDLLEKAPFEMHFVPKIFPDTFLKQELGIQKKAIFDLDNNNQEELIPPILDIVSNVQPNRLADNRGDLTIEKNTADTHGNDKGVQIEDRLQNNHNDDWEITVSPSQRNNDVAPQKVVDQVLQVSADANPKEAVIDDNIGKSDLKDETINDDCAEVSKNKTYSSVTFPEFIAFGKPGDPGENGQRFQFGLHELTKLETKKKDKDYKIHYFDEWISRKVAVHRSLPDNLPVSCTERTYTSLPAVSVLIVFYNEAWTTLLRTIHSILDRTPDNLLQEIILLDDFSNLDHLKEPLEVYLQPLSKVRLFRAKERLGLIRARNTVFDLASEEVVVFLDSHIECFPGWLEPLLAPIQANSKTVTFPTIEYINPNTFGASKSHSPTHLGGLNFNALSFTWLQPRQAAVSNIADNRPSPTMPGGLYAISRDFFRYLGKYDPGMDLWGSENVEISFKVWMCGGSLLLVPCSHVGHIFRRSNPAVHDSGVVLTYKNTVRVAEVWMDHYKHFFYEKIVYKIPEYGDVSSRVQLRNSLQCHDFRWYLDNIYPELKDEIDENSKYAGQIKNDETNMCIDRSVDRFLSAGPCDRRVGVIQFWILKTNGTIVSANKVIGVVTENSRRNVTKKRLGLFTTRRYDNHVDVIWVYDTHKRLVNKSTGLCLQLDSVLKEVMLKDCSNSIRQRWVITTRKEMQNAYKNEGVPINWNQ